LSGGEKAEPKLVLTNDDGIAAPGIEALFNALEGLGRRIIVAPAEPQSGVGHKVTTDTPIRVLRIGEDRFSIDGTPADCARIGLTRIAPDADFLFAGINRGGNLGADVYTSGTVAAAREAALLGFRAAAVSHYVARNCEIDWDVASARIAPVLRELLEKEFSSIEYWNVNLPHPPRNARPGIAHCLLDTRPHGVCYREEGEALFYAGDYHQRPREKGRDVDLCLGGKITITRILLDSADR
jgi:5'-nucleotidase